MPWITRDPEKNRPWRRARLQDIYDEVHTVRSYFTQVVSAMAGHTLQLNRIESRLASVEARLSPPPPDNIVDLDAARVTRNEWKDIDA